MVVFFTSNVAGNVGDLDDLHGLRAIRLFKETNRWRLTATFGPICVRRSRLRSLPLPALQIPLYVSDDRDCRWDLFRIAACGYAVLTKRGIWLTAMGILAIIVLLIPFWFDVRSTRN